MNAEQKAPLPGYRDFFGTKPVVIAEVAGPTSYATGGQTINAADFGLAGIDYADAGMVSYSGTYYGRIIPQPASAPPSNQNPNMTKIKLQWIVAATNAEVANTTNLSGEILRFLIIAPV